MARKTIRVTCSICRGSGSCKDCGGTGSGKKLNPHPQNYDIDTDSGAVKCFACGGSGKCVQCGGKGYEEEEVDDD